MRSCSGHRLDTDKDLGARHRRALGRGPDKRGVGATRGAARGIAPPWSVVMTNLRLRPSVRCGIAGLAPLVPAVGQQLVDPLGRMGADATQHIAEVRLRVDPQTLAGRAQAHQDRRRLAPLVAPREEPVLALMPSSALPELGPVPAYAEFAHAGPRRLGPASEVAPHNLVTAHPGIEAAS